MLIEWVKETEELIDDMRARLDLINHKIAELRIAQEELELTIKNSEKIVELYKQKHLGGCTPSSGFNR